MSDEATTREEMFTYLDKLRDGGTINMMASAGYLERKFGLAKRDAEEVMFAWMDARS